MLPIWSAALVRRIRAAVAGELSTRSAASILGARKLDRYDQAALARQLFNEELERHAQECLSRSERVLDEGEQEALAWAVFDRLFQLGRLQPVLDDERIQNIEANGHDQVFVEYADGTKVAALPIAADDAELIETLREIGRRYGLSERELNPSRPSLNLRARHAHGSTSPPDARCRYRLERSSSAGSSR